MIVSSANRKDKNEIVPCMVDKPINHLLNLLESCTAPLAIITCPVSSMVEHSAVNRKVLGSRPRRGANYRSVVQRLE